MEWERSCTADRKTTRSFQGRLLYIQPKQFDTVPRGCVRARRQSQAGRRDADREPGTPSTPPATFVDLLSSL